MSNRTVKRKGVLKGSKLENLVKEHFPKILKTLDFDISTERYPSARTNDITDVHKLEIKLNEKIKEQIEGKTRIRLKETTFNLAIECKAKESKSNIVSKIRDQDLLYKIPKIEADLPNVETWIILAPKSMIKDNSFRIIEKRNNETTQFYIVVWDANNHEFKQIFAVLGKDVWKQFFDDAYPSIDKQKIKYYLRSIFQKGKEKHTEYMNQKAGIFAVKKYQELLENIKHTMVGHNRNEFREIHNFLDKINTLLDNHFLIVKKRLYDNVWKIGLAYYEYKDTHITYRLYPISFERNDVQIKEVNKKLHEELVREGLTFTGHYIENPIKNRPEEYAIDFIESKALKILEYKLLYHKGNDFLAREFIFAFIDRFSQQMGLDKKDKYSIDEIERAFSQYLPVWTVEAIEFMIKVQRNGVKSYHDCLYRKPYFDPEMLITCITNVERKQIAFSVTECIKKKEIPRIPIENKKLPLRIFAEFISFLKLSNVKEINRPYLQKDYSRHEKNAWIWNVFSPVAAEKNLKILFENLPKVYDDIVLQNFPDIVKELPLYAGVSRIIIIFNFKEEYKSFEDSPSIQSFYLYNENDQRLEIEQYKKEDTKIPKIAHENFKNGVEIDGKKYRLISMSNGHLDFIYDDLPMFDFIYKILHENLKDYFHNLKKQI